MVNDMELHISRLAVLEIAVGALHVAAGIFLMVVAGGTPFRFGVQQEETFVSVMVSLISLLLLVTGGSAIVGGRMLQSRTQKGKIAGLFAAFLMIVVVPFGTIVGSYGIWVLFQNEADASFPSHP